MPCTLQYLDRGTIAAQSQGRKHVLLSDGAW